MPKSRTRRRRRSAPARRHTPATTKRATGRPPGVSDDEWAKAQIVLAVDATEARGDATGALDLIEAALEGMQDQRFWRPSRVLRLTQLVTVAELPRWAVSRWVLAQAAGAWSNGDRFAEAARAAVEAGADDRLPVGIGEVDRAVQIADRDWVYRQVLLYDLGGLTAFLPSVSADLLDGADALAAWSTCPMGGFRYLGSGDSVTRWFDLAAGSVIEVDDLGSACQLLRGEHVIGRLVPTEGRRLFESVPLAVPQVVAEDVAADPGSWATVLAEARRDGHRFSTSGFDFGLLHDVPDLWWQRLLPALAHERGARSHSRPAADKAELARHVLDIVRAVDDAGELDTWPEDDRSDLGEVESCVFAAVLDPVVFADLLGLVRRSDQEALHTLAHRVAEPAAHQLELLTAWCRIKPVGNGDAGQEAAG